MSGPDISFSNLGIKIETIKQGISIFGFQIAFYAMIITLGIFLGVAMATYLAKKDGQDIEMLFDFALIVIPLSIIGARVYYVIFEWSYYKNHVAEIFNMRKGGLAIYGAVIVAFATCIIFCKIRKVNFAIIMDCGVEGLLVGQILGRWGNFFNCEAFGGYTNNPFAMRIKRTLVDPSLITKELNEKMAEHFPEIADAYIQVHPTFLYESLWNLVLLIILLVYRKHRKFSGEVGMLYLFGYGIGRFWIEGLRTDQLTLGNTGIAVSQLLSAILVVASLGIIIYGRIKAKKAVDKA